MPGQFGGTRVTTHEQTRDVRSDMRRTLATRMPIYTLKGALCRIVTHVFLIDHLTEITVKILEYQPS